MKTNLLAQSSLLPQFDNYPIIQGVIRLAHLSRRQKDGEFRSFSKDSLVRLDRISYERKCRILNQINMAEKILSSGNIEEPVSKNHDEWSLISKALSLYGLHLKDDFQSVLAKNDVIEIYNADHIQIFRTFNFYKYSAYSYLDLLVNEWFHLWERPKFVINSLMWLGYDIAVGNRTGIVPLDYIPTHVFREIHNSEEVESFKARSALCQFQHAAPLYDANNAVAGLIISCQVKETKHAEAEVKGLSFI